MNQQQTLLGIFLILYLALGFATTPVKSTKAIQKTPGHYNLEAMGSYNNFRFSSDNSGGYNKYNGQSYITMLGGHKTKIKENWLAGLFFYNAYVQLNSDVLISPGAPANTYETIINNNLMAHILHQITPHWYVDVLGSYGQSKMTYLTSIGSSTEENNSSGNATGYGNNWFTSLTGGYVGAKNNFLVRAYVSALFSQINQQTFSLNFPSTAIVNNIPSLTNNATFLLEHLEITYGKSQYIQPFMSAGLLEVLQFSNSRLIVDGLTLPGALPEFNLNQNGFRAGGGINFNYKKLIVRLEQQYNQRGSVYRSNQSIVTLIWSIS